MFEVKATLLNGKFETYSFWGSTVLFILIVNGLEYLIFLFSFVYINSSLALSRSLSYFLHIQHYPS